MATLADQIAASGDCSAVTTPFRRLAEFSPDTESIEVYTERFKVFANAKNIDESRKAQLKKLAATCEFGSFLEESLRDRLISGLRSKDIRCRLLSLPNKGATWERVLNIATAMETAKNDTKEILPAPDDVNC
ncbi:hypothetical protein HPB52_012765 [Rhipicephalus sanguineus]|uniref:Tick transposon n=1 Tax=Rhipicephalus sanguineus TaxID=34632 RepID=A0A9D4QEL1_RHISA|nr:hypothetical protein HPB52_012765 [Rhipicephalus sanguineus]